MSVITEREQYHVASFSGGKDSTAMVLHLIETGAKLDEVIYCDTYKEFPAMYRHIEKVKKVIQDAGIKFTELRSEKSFDYLMFDHEVNRRSKAVIEKYGNPKGYSWAGSLTRWCTSKLKIQIIERYLKSLNENFNVIQYTGIAADEQYRLERENNKKQLHPLVDWGWDEKTCLEYCYSQGYDWEGLYELFHRVSCWCCPLQSLEELRKLRIHFPELWSELKDMDNRTWRNFRADYSVNELEIRFDFEEERISYGLSITNNDFRQKLKEKIRKEGESKMTNTLKLKAAIMESGFNQRQLAETLGMTIATFNYKVNNKSEFKASEIKKLCEVLNITDVNTIFLADKVE
jgi:3'-phosphoadenosine 5'-phosphosulfate sulfotransferase (PAPS reductase)/FAD synthetase